VKIIGLSVDPVDRHASWSKDTEETQGYSYRDRGLSEMKLADLSRRPDTGAD
jgi:thioredoxin-dependent peroxiredoxin